MQTLKSHVLLKNNMGRGPKLTVSEKKKIIEFNKKNMSLRVIAKKIVRSHNVVRSFLKDPLIYGTKKTTGRKKKVTPRLKRHILNKVSNTRISANKIIDELSLQMCRMTIYRTIKSAPHMFLEKKRNHRFLHVSINLKG